MAEQYLIIGQGLAGTILSYEFLKRNIPHKVLDNNHHSAATLAAAGIINPVTGRRYVKSWMIDDLLPVAQQTYQELERLLAKKFVSYNNILRSLEDRAQENRWHEATGRPGYEPYVEKEADLAGFGDLVNTRPAYGEIKQAIQVTVPELIIAYKELLIEKELLVIRQLSYDEIDYAQSEYLINGEAYTKLIFCEGYKAIHNPLFSMLPFQPAKGESFLVDVEDQLPAKLLRDKIFIAPQASHRFWTGGGYLWDDPSEEPTPGFKEQWLDKLTTLLKVPYKVAEHRVGVRPSVQGRRPLVGQHKLYPNIYLLNGMGTKGTSLIPYWARELVELLINSKPINPEVDLNRFLT